MYVFYVVTNRYSRLTSRQSQLPLRDLKSLRLVCSWLNLSMEPLVLSCITLDVPSRTLTTTMHQLETLANQRSQASQFTRTLKIVNLSPCRDLTLLGECLQYIGWEVESLASADAVEAGMRTHLVPVISLLKNVETVM
jgi:hypothetical protein